MIRDITLVDENIHGIWFSDLAQNSQIHENELIVNFDFWIPIQKPSLIYF